MRLTSRSRPIPFRKRLSAWPAVLVAPVSGLMLALASVAAYCATVPETPDAWTEFDNPAAAAAAGWSALPSANPSLSTPKLDAWAGNAVQATGWNATAGGGLKIARAFGLPAYGAGSTLQFYVRAEANNPGSSGTAPVVVRARFPGGSVYRNLLVFTAGPNPLSLHLVDMDISAATTSSDPWTTWRKDADGGTLTNDAWGSLQSLEWTADTCSMPADFIQIDRLSFDMQSGTARLGVKALNVPSRKYLIAHLEPQGLGTGTISCTLEVLDSSGSVVLRREAPIPANQTRDVRVDYGSLPQGAYIIRGSAYRADQLLAQGQAAFNHLADPPWVTAKTGIDASRVVKPWTPITTGDRHISAWGRTMTWGSSIFPDSISSAGEELLAAPMRLTATIGAETQTIRLKSFRFTKQTGARVEAEAVGDICGVEAVTKIAADFDGFVWFEIRLKDPKRAVVLNSLRIEAPMRASQTRLFQTFRPSTEGAGAIGSSPIQIGWAVNDWVAK